jgi:hypothetical protein
MLTHGYSNTPTYRIWGGMKDRCYREKNQDYHHYGGRGIKVCDRWLGADGFVNFLADMGVRPKSMTIDRLDPNGNYEPSNCRWATRQEQTDNRRETRRYEGKVIREWASILGMNYGSLKSTADRYKSLERAVVMYQERANKRQALGEEQ